MNTYIFEGKTIEETTDKALLELNTTEENILIKIIEEKQGLLKKFVKIEVISINDAINYIKESIKEIINLMNIKVNLEIKRREKNITFTIFSNNNPILIGKNGKTIQALQNIVRQIIPDEINKNFKIMIDVENYKERKINNIERIAKQVAKEVTSTKVESKLECMNSFERRAVHNILSNNKYVYTESIGTEPNRYVVIKPKED